jgi:hypothetical protein
MKYISLLLIALLAACGRHSLLSDNAEVPLPKSAGQLMSIADTDTAYTNYFNMQPMVTPDGWNITYMVKNDSTRFTDAYIQWQKGNVKRVYKYPHVLEYRGQFMPQFLDETSTHIFMGHACATDCRAILALPKNNTGKAVDFTAVIGYDLNLNRIVCKGHSNYNRLKAVATDLNRHKTKSVTFKSPFYSMDIGYAPTDTIIFESDRIIISCDFFDADGETVRETQVIQF